jgi:EAL domain-containing protein (putative c-di-GMP-specific phosphodiesterase class I)/CheY-like chemotaxis protein
MRPASVLLVDDDAFLRDVTAEMLSQVGSYRVLAAADGTEALALLEAAADHPDAIVCDLDMAGMDGIQLLRHLGERHYRGTVVLMSGAREDILATARDLAHLHGLRLTGVLRKPVDADGLRQALQVPAPDLLAGGGPRSDGATSELSPDELRRGIGEGRVLVHVQPKVTVSDRRVVGAEALLRWLHPAGALLPPSAVVPVAEACGLVNELTMAVFARAVEALADWQAEGLTTRISVNLSHDNLTSLALPDAMSSVAQSAGVDASRITLEISQTGLVEDLAIGMEVVGRLRLKGFGIAIDDYGMGYSTLRQLKNLPVTEIKVDRSLVEGAEVDATLTEILGSSTSLGRSLGLAVVAQGVETAEVLALLESLGCDEMQGYLVARAMPAPEFPEWVRRWHAAWHAAQGGAGAH